MSSLHLQQSELWEITRRLIGFNTVSAASNVEACEYLATLLDESGFTVHLYREEIDGVAKASVIASIGPAVPDGLIISGHTDVVPYVGQPGWRTDPEELSTDGQYIYGRGVADMKAFLAQSLVAARRIDLAKIQRPLVFIFTCDEEVAGQGSGRLIHVLPDYFTTMPLPSVALIGEPTNFEIFPAHKGYAVFDIHVRGRGGHSSMPDQGLSAIANMARVINILQEMNQGLQQRVTPENHQLFPDSPVTMFNYGVIQGGLGANMIAETCQLTASVRIAPGDDIDVLLTQLQARIDREVTAHMKAVDPDCTVNIEDYVAIPPLRSPVTGPFATLLRQVTGRSGEQGAPFATDGGYFRELGVHSYIFGPGQLTEAHQPNESLPVAHFLDGVDYLERIITGWCMSVSS